MGPSPGRLGEYNMGSEHMENTVSQQDMGSSPLVEQIVALVLEALTQHDEFDAETIARLQDLAQSGDLPKFERVVLALSTGEE